MNKAMKIWLIIATSAVLLGVIVFGVAMSALNWDFRKLETARFETNEHEISEQFHNIKIKTDTADILFVISDDNQCRVVCYEETKAKHSVSVVDDTLVINAIDNKAWYDYIGLRFSSPEITVYLPSAAYNSLTIDDSTGDIEIPKEIRFNSMDISVSTGDVRCDASATGAIQIKTTTGDIQVEDITAESLKLSASTGEVKASGVSCKGDFGITVSTGKAKLSDIRCQNLMSTGSTGDISLLNVIAAEKVSVNRSTGDVRFDGLDADEIFVKTSTGDVRGTLLSEKVFIVSTSTGKKDVPATITGGRCEIKSSTGDIIITISQAS